jgi:PhzF family phenazine biosynthesis protein
MRLYIYQIDAFTDKLFCGNPAAVIPLQQWLDDVLMQQIALENNLSETAFIVPLSNNEADYEIRWFTPEVEINLCGHATVASAYVIFELLYFAKDTVTFKCKSGLLQVTKNGDLFVLNFPSWKPERWDNYPENIGQMLGGIEIIGVYKHRDVLVELADEASVKNCQPDFSLMKKHIDKLIITAPGKTVDFVSRFFAPGAGVNEDPVTGSAHSQLIPFWSEKLHKTTMHALQVSKRGGELWCQQLNEQRVTIAGKAVFYMQGTIEI